MKTYNTTTKCDTIIPTGGQKPKSKKPKPKKTIIIACVVAVLIIAASGQSEETADDVLEKLPS